MAKRNDQIWLWGALAAAAGVGMFTARKSIVSLFGQAVTAGREYAFKLSLPSHAQEYSETILQVARESGIDPYLIFALGDRESGWGRYLDPPGPTGTGDNGNGYGLMQIDSGSWSDWLATYDWTDPLVNIRKGVEILKGKLDYFKKTPNTPTVTLDSKQASRRGVSPGTYSDVRPLSGQALWEAGIAAYNTGELNVLRNLAAGKPAEFTTAHGDYVADVLNRGQKAASKLA